MKKFLSLILILCLGSLIGISFGQDTKTQSKKSGFAVGGYDNTRQEKEKSTVTKRSVVIEEEAAPAEKAMDVPAPQMQEPVPAPSPAPAPAAAPAPQKSEITGKSVAQPEKQKAKNKAKTKERR